MQFNEFEKCVHFNLHTRKSRDKKKNQAKVIKYWMGDKKKGNVIFAFKEDIWLKPPAEYHSYYSNAYCIKSTFMSWFSFLFGKRRRAHGLGESPQVIK